MTRTPLIHLGLALGTLLMVVGGTVGMSVFTNNIEAKSLALHQEIVEKEQEAERVARAQETLPELALSEAMMSTYILNTADIVPFLEQLEKQGKAQGTVIEVVSVQANKTTTAQRIQLSLKISGTFDAVMRTFGTLEYGPRDIEVHTVTLDGGTDEAGKIATWTAVTALSIGAVSEAPKAKQP